MEEEQILGDRYRLVRRIGEGGMSVVWEAQDQVLGRPVAVKVLAAAYASDAGSRRRIRAEAKAVARLSHPHVTAVYDYGESLDDDGNKVPYIVMELLPGRTLAARLAEGPLRPRAGLRICAEVASALAAAHARNVVHRDVKPANVVLTPDGAKVVDFGIAAAVGQADEINLDGPMFGTPAYLAPERLTDEAVVAASDVYALGLLLYRVLTDRLPWQVETTTQMLVAHVYVEPAPLPPVSGLPPEVAEIYLACVAKDPADRPPAGEVALALARAAGIQLRPHDDEPAAAAPVPSAPAPEGRRSRVSIVATIGLVVAALVATAFAFSGSVGDTGPVTTAPSASVDVSAEGLGQVGRTDVPRSTGPGSVGPGATGPAEPSGPGDAPAVTPSREPGGGGPGVSPTAGPPPTSAPVTRTLTSDGGSVVATCQGTKAELLSIDPAPGYVINSANSGPATQVGVVFKGPTAAVRLNVMCTDGEPRVIN